MTAVLRAVTAPAALVVFLLALVVVLLLPDGLAYAMGRVSREGPRGTASPSPPAPFVELPRFLTGYVAPQHRTPAPAPPPEHPGPFRSGIPHSPASVPSTGPEPSTGPSTTPAVPVPPLPGTQLPFPFTALPVPHLPSAPATSAFPSGDPHRPGSPGPSAPTASAGVGAAGADASVSPSRTGHEPPKAAPSPAVSLAVPPAPSLLPLAPPAPARGRASLSPKGEVLAEEMPLADDVPSTVGARGTGFLTDGRGRLVLGGGLICLGFGLATALLAFRLRRA